MPHACPDIACLAVTAPRRDFSSLQLPELLRRFTARQHYTANQQTWYQQHPQQLLPPTPRMQTLLDGVVDWKVYNPDDGFVGFGVNLVHLNPQLLGLAVQLRASPGGRGTPEWACFLCKAVRQRVTCWCYRCPQRTSAWLRGHHSGCYMCDVGMPKQDITF